MSFSRPFKEQPITAVISDIVPTIAARYNITLQTDAPADVSDTISCNMSPQIANWKKVPDIPINMYFLSSRFEYAKTGDTPNVNYASNGYKLQTGTLHSTTPIKLLRGQVAIKNWTSLESIQIVGAPGYKVRADILLCADSGAAWPCGSTEATMSYVTGKGMVPIFVDYGTLASQKSPAEKPILLDIYAYKSDAGYVTDMIPVSTIGTVVTVLDNSPVKILLDFKNSMNDWIGILGAGIGAAEDMIQARLAGVYQFSGIKSFLSGLLGDLGAGVIAPLAILIGDAMLAGWIPSWDQLMIHLQDCFSDMPKNSMLSMLGGFGAMAASNIGGSLIGGLRGLVAKEVVSLPGAALMYTVLAEVVNNISFNMRPAGPYL